MDMGEKAQCPTRKTMKILLTNEEKRMLTGYPGVIHGEFRAHISDKENKNRVHVVAE